MPRRRPSGLDPALAAGGHARAAKRLSRVATSATLALALLLAPEATRCDVTRDGSLGSRGAGVVDNAVDANGIRTFTIGEADGELRGSRNLFLSFDRFDLLSNEIADFTGSASIENFFSRITGGRSSVDGRIRSSVAGANLFFLNPDGMLFGPNAALDVTGSFVVSSADFIDLSDGGRFEASPFASNLLTLGDPVRFGFLGGPIGSFEVRGRLETQPVPGLEAEPAGSIAFYGGDLLIDGGVLSALDADVFLVSLASSGTIHVDPTGASLPTLEGVSERGDVRVVNEAIISSSGLSPLITRWNEPGRPESFLVVPRQQDGQPDGTPQDPPPFDLPEGAVPYGYFSFDGPGGTTENVVLYAIPDFPSASPASPGAPAFSRGAGRVLVLGNDLTIEDSDIRANTVGDDSGGIDLQLTGDLTIRRISSTSVTGLIARTGERLSRPLPDPAPCSDALAGVGCAPNPNDDMLNDFGPLSFDFDEGTGRGGDISITARNVRLEGGGLITASSRSRGSPGSILLDVADEIVVTGRDASQPAETFASSAIFSNHEGRPQANGAGRAGGDIRIAGSSLLLEDGGGVFAQTTGDGNAGSIHVDVDRLEIRDDSQIDSSTSGQSVADPSVDPLATGEGGEISIVARESILLSGNRGPDDFARVSTFSGEASVGGAGTIRVDTPRLRIEAGAGIAVTTRGSGAGGDIDIEADRVRLETAARLSAASESAVDPAGEITITTTGPFDLLTGSSINASTGINTGGTIEIDAGDVVALGGGSEIRADAALPGGSGGRVVIAAPLVVASSTSSVTASAPGGPEFQGEVEIRSPVVTLEDQLKPPEASLLDASSMLLSRCGARRSGERAGSFQVARWPDRPSSFEGPLLAFGPIPPAAPRTSGASSEPGNTASAAPDSPSLALRDPLRKDESLESAVASARGSGDAATIAASLNQLGNLRSVEGRWSDARTSYLESARRAEEADRPLLASQALANAARTELTRGSVEAAAPLLSRAAQGLDRLESETDLIALQLHLAESYRIASEARHAIRRPALTAAHRLLAQARANTISSGDSRTRSQVFGRLGSLYESEGERTREAAYLTRRAIAEAEQARAPDLLARWSFQAGRIARQQGDRSRALDHLRRAVRLIEEIHPETLARQPGSELDFRRAVEPYYTTLVDVLLSPPPAAELDDASAAAAVPVDLEEARDTLERWKAAELRDYFRDDCVASLEAREKPIDIVADDAAVVYPILLPDRIEILVSTRAGIERHRVPVEREQVLAQVRSFRELLGIRTSYELLRPARSLYDWLVAPYAAELAAAGIDTLVFVPGEALRTIPMSALHDGRAFLIESFSVAVTPTLQLIAPRRVSPDTSRILLAGLTESVLGHQPLENVQQEVDSIRALYGGEVLMNRRFESERFEESMRERPPGIVHIASHAAFTGDPETSYVLAYDRKLSMDGLSRLVRSNRFGREPLELLVLSACETASGDDRSALGLAGLAIRSGARSAVGSLWSVNDEATSELIVSFYRALGDPASSKAEALARGQRQLIGSTRFDHPFYWAGFLVINNWL